MEGESGIEAVIIFFLHHTRNFLISATSSPGICDIEPASHQRSFTKGKHTKQIKHKDLYRKSSNNDTNILNNVFYPICNDGF